MTQWLFYLDCPQLKKNMWSYARVFLRRGCRELDTGSLAGHCMSSYTCVCVYVYIYIIWLYTQSHDYACAYIYIYKQSYRYTYILLSLFDLVFIESQTIWYGKIILLKKKSFAHILKRFVLRYTTGNGEPGEPGPRPRRWKATLNLQGGPGF